MRLEHMYRPYQLLTDSEKIDFISLIRTRRKVSVGGMKKKKATEKQIKEALMSGGLPPDILKKLGLV